MPTTHSTTRRAFIVALTRVAMGCSDVSDVRIGADARDAATVDRPLTDAVTSGGDAMPLPRLCAVPPECVGACPPGARGCTCAATPMGLRCVPTCLGNLDCGLGPMGVQTFCRMGICAP